MITAIDTNVLLDVLSADPKHGPKSREALKASQRTGRLVVCEIVLAELSRYFTKIDDLKETLGRLGIASEPLGEEACHLAGQAFLQYRKRGGKRDRILSDFLIGAHAQVRCTRLLTRDRGFYRDYFSELEIIDPSIA
ncbi:MAG TPA: type II toxin-antitoxin system VapC family toxin [Anaerolineales bacterium]|nr:type II toxin-antitoxin system VapC family toxin [Anaerolineales bacterium]